MSKVKIELNSAGIRQLLRSNEVASMLRQEANNRAAGLGEGYATDSYMTPGRAVSSIYTETASAARREQETNAMLKAVSG